MTNKAIILAVTNDLTYDRRVFRICSALSSAGLKVTLIGRMRRDSKIFHPETFNASRFRCWFNKGPFFYAEFNIRLFFILLKADFDMACACDLDTAMAVRLACRLKKKKSVYDAHEYFTEVPELNDRPGVKKIWGWIAKKTIPGFNAWYTVGEELAALMGQKYGVRFDVIRNIAPSIDSGQLPIVKIPGNKILLYQGALNVGRGLEACINSMVYLKDWQLWLAGEGDITERLKNQAKSMGVEERVEFLGWVRPDNLPRLLNQARLCINLREKGSMNDFYSLPNKFFDAIHAGVPSINMNYPEYARVCGRYPCALLIDEVKVEKIVEAVLHLDKNPEEYQAMVLACRDVSTEYSWEKEKDKLISIYSKL